MIREVEVRLKLNQAQHQPLTRSDLLYNELCGRHPNLASSIIQGRDQALECYLQDSLNKSVYGSLDSPRISSYQERNMSSSSLPRASFKSSPHIPSPRTRSPLILPRQSPLLQPNGSPLLRPIGDSKGTGDLIFEMDEEFETVRPSYRSPWKITSNQSALLSSSPAVNGDTDDGWMDSHGKPLKSNSPSFRPVPNIRSMTPPSKSSNNSDLSQVSTPSKMYDFPCTCNSSNERRLYDNLPRLPGSAPAGRRTLTASSRSSSYSIPIEPLLKTSQDRRRKSEQRGSVSPSSSNLLPKQAPWNVPSNRKASTGGISSPTTSNVQFNKHLEEVHTSPLNQPRPSSRLSQNTASAENKAPVLSLASIMAQQQDEVFYHQEQLDQVKGKSFREIQEQEAFEKWWKAESQKVQNAEALANQSKGQSRKNRKKNHAITL